MPSTDPSPSPQPRPGLIRRTFRRHWRGLLAVWAIGTLAVGSLVYSSVKPDYRAFSFIRVEPPSPHLFGIAPKEESMDAFLQTQVQLIASPNVLTAAGSNPKVAVLDRVQKAGDIVQFLRKAISVVVIPGTYLIEVSVTSPNAHETATIVNGVVDAFLEANIEWSDGMTRANIKNLEQYQVDIRVQIDELERKWKSIARKGDLDLPARQANLISPEHGAKIEEKLIENDLARLEAQSRLDALLARPPHDRAKAEDLEARIDAANRLEKALNERRASAAFNPRNGTEKSDDVEIKLLQEERATLRGMHDDVARRLEQLRYEAKGQARVRPVNPGGAVVPGKPVADRRSLAMAVVPFAVFALAFAGFAGFEAMAGATKAPAAKEAAKPEV